MLLLLPRQYRFNDVFNLRQREKSAQIVVGRLSRKILAKIVRDQGGIDKAIFQLNGPAVFLVHDQRVIGRLLRCYSQPPGQDLIPANLFQTNQLITVDVMPLPDLFGDVADLQYRRLGLQPRDKGAESLMADQHPRRDQFPDGAIGGHPADAETSGELLFGGNSSFGQIGPVLDRLADEIFDNLITGSDSGSLVHAAPKSGGEKIFWPVRTDLANLSMIVYTIFEQGKGKFMHTGFSSCQSIWTNVRIATMDPAIRTPFGLLLDHALGVANGRIKCLAPQQALDLRAFPGQLHDARGGCLTPGLIDSHTHLVYGGHRANEFTQRLRGTSYADIARAGGGILSTVLTTRALSETELIDQARPRLEALCREGVTTVEIKSGYGLTVQDELKILRAAGKLAAEYPLRLRRTLLAAHVVPPEYLGRADAYVELICQELIPQVAEKQLAEAVDAFCEPLAFSPVQCERIFAAAGDAGLGIKVHAEQLSNSGGASLASLYSAWSADHLEYLDEAGILAIKRAGTVATLLPGAFYFLGETRKPPVERLRSAQVPMAVASDLNPGSSPLASLRLMLNMACVLFGLSPEESLRGATEHAAAALGLAGQVGVLRPGLAADMLLWDLDDPAQLACQFGTPSLRQRIFAGEVSHA